MEKLKCNSGNFYIVAVAVVEDKDGEVKKVRKTIVVEATSFGDAELMASDSMSDYSVGDVEITVNENTGKAKKTKQYMLIQANCLNRATSYLDEIMRGSMVDYSSVSVSETKIFDSFFIHKVKAND